MSSELIKDFEIHIKVKNARLLNKIQSAGFRSVRDFAHKTGLSAQGIYKCLSLKYTVYNKRFVLRELPKKLGEFFDCLPTDLFPESVWYEEMEITTASIQMDEEEVRAALPYLSRGEIPRLENQMDAEKLMTIAKEVLTEKEYYIIEHRYSGDKLDEIGKDWDIGKERVRQIQFRAERKIRGKVRDIGMDF